ncbi:hypothetical protein TVAG_401010 [Trichomonas vaginalis G3]|uniref:Uncharacterized protein n=1 Tax=Trichomonas vaginalis (strain ATCC PRA-98 / G3) TaxID=412133 RepID=A2E3K9_TRIV3|nr:organellar and viral DNA polymerase type B [Trichomonas vaginalis G3]EAY12775.1 hypothetical protein TVAG_401010 [Trichomonas vaginalis G3]KAI5505597.1 organellar and viral DNA polymerase type B [Trichomonas vaginalis G3]|eukprot:XP_001324998.1 hypothetical protein [Trichomonas vaginalis G3]
MHYDFFLTNIKNLTEIKMYDLTEYEGLTMSDVKKGKPKKRPYRDESTLTNDQKAILEALKQTGNPALIESFWKDNGEKKFYKKRSGQFWKYLCTLPINLERYQIFNELNQRTAALMTEDNCFVYACIQAGVDGETIDEKTRIFEKVTPTIKVILLLDLFTNYKIISLTEYIFNINKKLFLYKKLQSIDKYYKTFIPKRLSNRWDPAYNIILCHKAYKF